MRYFFPLSLFTDPFGGYKTITQQEANQILKNRQAKKTEMRIKNVIQNKAHISQKDKEIVAKEFKQIEQNWDNDTPLRHLVNMIKCASVLGLDYQVHKDKMIEDVLREKFKNLPDINVQNEEGDTLLHIIASTGDENFASLELFTKSIGIDYNILNHAGKSALHIAIEKGAAESIKLLQLHTTDLTIWKSFIQKEYHKQYNSISDIKDAIQKGKIPFCKPEYSALHILNEEWEKAYANLQLIYQKLREDYDKAQQMVRRAESNLFSLSVFFTFPKFFKCFLNSDYRYPPEINQETGELILFTVNHNKAFTDSLFRAVIHDTTKFRLITYWCTPISKDENNEYIYFKKLTLFFLTHPQFTKIPNDANKLSLIERLVKQYCSEEEQQLLTQQSNPSAEDFHIMQEAVIKSLRSTMQLEERNNGHFGAKLRK
jgi:hypothetical protein